MTTAPPTPPDTDPAAFVAALRRLKAWSGLSYRRLERLATEAGHVLPHSTAATMLGRERLPREEPLAAFVAACGLRGAEAEAWTDARRRIACGQPGPPSLARPVSLPRPGRRRVLAVAALSLTALLGGALTSGALTEDEEVRDTRTVHYDASRDR
ncbi:hypothetical protein [Streptomyces stelliscabiei]|uniref:Uncharacterized protein n=1 Tax=Streptomyces stelliscabiei TaxID=146820 RepID=A0A8I0PD12_9ACTN|nr:hypothetical protein [Streptomyces stelliscabiei]KND42386.1 hypothetical protein IQ64_23980 [Streptomyces stelliscabiei]MBE1600464.1 hypothetical protein [Streptomyces stelliscabiei]MDX2518280.1 hypothetical protein [Streptomyces stelliscabiei]